MATDRDNSMKAAEQEERKGDARRRPSIFRWSAKPESAAKHYQRAFEQYQAAAARKECLTMLEKQSEALSEAGDSFSAGRALEQAFPLAKQLGGADERMREFALRASEHYAQCNKAHAGAFALQRAAPSIQDASMKAELYEHAASLLTQEERTHEALEPRRQQCAALALANDTNACVSALLTLGSEAEQTESPHQQAQAYLSAIVTLLYASNASAALATLSDAREVDSFERSEQCSAAIALLDAYKSDGTRDGIRRTVRDHPSFRHLEQAFARRALSLPSNESALFDMAASLADAGNSNRRVQDAAAELEQSAADDDNGEDFT